MHYFVEGLKIKLDYINTVVKELDLNNVHFIIGEPTKYALQSEGKRLRPMICMLSAELVGCNYKKTKDAFLALELIHNGTLIHDDIIDEDFYRRGHPSVQVKFDVKRAVLTGDALLSLGLDYATRTGNIEIVNWLAGAALKMIQGVSLQTFFRRKKISETTYLEINYLKSGSLFECAAAIGGLVGTNNPREIETLAAFGKNFGNAYQIRDDLCGVFAENVQDDLARNDIINGDISLPLIYALKSDEIDMNDSAYLVSVYSGMSKNPDINEIQRIYEESGALQRSIERMKFFADNGRKYINNFQDSEAKETLIHLLDRYYSKFDPKIKMEVLLS